MDHRELGRSGLRIPPIVFGGNVFDWTADKPTSHRLLDRMVQAGLTAIDTADIYSSWAPSHSGGESETVIGEWLAATGKRDEVVVMTKLGGPIDGAKGLHPDRIPQAAEASLKRLRTDRIDLYQSHFDDPEVPLADTLGALARLIEQGKVRAIGASNYTAERLREALHASAAHNLPRYESLQPHYNLVERDFERDLGPLCLEQQIGVIPYFSLAAGFLTGKYRTKSDTEGRARGGNVAKYLDERGLGILSALDDIAADLDATQAEVALAWLIAQPGVTAPIASATSLDQLETLIRAATLTLPELALTRLNALDQAGSASLT
jgi:aryl-alcohol dehydrogenase-like predicted oxidoreductase